VVLVLSSFLARRLRADAPRFGLAHAVVAGIAPPVAAVLAWLAHAGGLGAFARAMRDASSSKGPLHASLTRIVTVLVEEPVYTAAFATAAAAALLLAIDGRPGRWLGRRLRLRRPAGGLGSAILLAAVAVGGVLTMVTVPEHTRLPQLVAVELGAWGSLVAAAASIRRLWRGGVSREGLQWLHLTLLSWAIAYALSLSWGAFELMACPAFAAALAAAATPSIGAGLVRARTAAVLSAAVLASALWIRWTLPFYWVFWREAPVAEDKVVPDIPALAGMRLSQASARFYARVTDDIRRSSEPGEALFVSPHLAILHVLADRPPATYSPITFFDVGPDAVAITAAKQLVSSPPRVMVLIELDEVTIAHFERLFRAGRPSGQRELAATLKTLTPLYREIDRVALPGTDVRAHVLVRKDP
jgi:hypothetical protein